ncbi:MAG: prolyl oligopeptidase family serine peptidase [Clostridia bacterium]|nr:prolyl oligopeptidase family serine peptidase [Clostridia bacterium]
MDDYNILEFNGMQYAVKFPKDYEIENKYPVLMFLHGAGTRGNDINKVFTNPFFEEIQKHSEFPFIVVAPLCNADTWFDIFSNVIEFTKYISTISFTDERKIYGIGASMGGYALWQLAMSCPEVFAAIVPICGGGMYWNAARIKDIPVWAFHGAKDDVVSMDESERMVDAVNRAGGNARLTVYPESAHDAWTDTYGNYGVFEWLLENEKQGCKVNTTEMNSSKIYG